MDNFRKKSFKNFFNKPACKENGFNFSPSRVSRRGLIAIKNDFSVTQIQELMDID